MHDTNVCCFGVIAAAQAFGSVPGAGSDEDDREQGGEVSRGDAFIGSGGAGSAAGMFMQDATIEQISRMTL